MNRGLTTAGLQQQDYRRNVSVLLVFTLLLFSLKFLT